MKNRQDASPRRKPRNSAARSAEYRPARKPEPQEVYVDVTQVEGAFRTLRPELIRAIVAEGYVTPTPVQEQSIPHLMKGLDLLGTAQTGTGKTAAFALPLLERMSKNKQRPQSNFPHALILAPTRELAAQIGDSLTTYGRHLRVSHTVIFGGVPQYHQVRALQRGVDILVATPGRLLDLAQQGHVQLSAVEVFVLDEVDRMLDMGFMPDIQRVLEQVPEERQTLFFSATMPPKMEKLAEGIVRDPVRVSIEPEQLTVDRISQRVLFVGKKDKDALLLSLLSDTNISKAIVFTQMKHQANKVAEKLGEVGTSAVAIHGNKSQSVRIKALQGFRQGRYRVLVATDVAARGLDVDDVTHVINYDLPVEAETYVHRIGRTARAGAGGDAISFCSAEERAYLRDIERMLGQSVPPQLDHEYHDNASMLSTLPAPPNFGKGATSGEKRGRGRNTPRDTGAGFGERRKARPAFKTARPAQKSSHTSQKSAYSTQRPEYTPQNSSHSSPTPTYEKQKPPRSGQKDARRHGSSKGNFDLFIRQAAAASAGSGWKDTDADAPRKEGRRSDRDTREQGETSRRGDTGKGYARDRSKSGARPAEFTSGEATSNYRSGHGGNKPANGHAKRSATSGSRGSDPRNSYADYRPDRAGQGGKGRPSQAKRGARPGAPRSQGRGNAAAARP